MKNRVVILGGGFGGLELATVLSETLGDDVAVTLIDKNDAFVFGYSKLDVLFGRTTMEAVRLPYRDLAKPGVRFLQQTITAIDPEARVVTTNDDFHEADYLVVALGADYDLDAKPGLAGGATSSTPRPAQSGWPDCFPASRRVARSSVSAGRRSSARPRRARPHCCCTTICRRAGSARTARSRSSSRSGALSRRPRRPHARWSTPSPSATSSSSPTAA